MRRVLTGLALALGLASCGGLLPQPLHDSSPAGAMAHVVGTIPDSPAALGFDGPNGTCIPSVWVTGTIVSDAGWAAIKSDGGVVRQLYWWHNNPAVVDWNRRYTIGGRPFNGPLTLWACGGADSVIPR